MPRRKKQNQDGASTPRRTPPETFPAFVAEVERELASRIGGTNAADFVARDPSFGNLFRLTFDMRNAVGNPVKKCAGLIVDALASAMVAELMRMVAQGVDCAPTKVPAAKTGHTGVLGIVPREPRSSDEPGIAGTVERLTDDLLGGEGALKAAGVEPTDGFDSSRAPGLGEQLSGNPTARANAQSWEDSTPRRRSPRAAGSKTGGESPADYLPLSSRVDERPSEGSGPIDVG